MRIAFLLNRFPLLSETFILNQITGLIDRGLHVDIYVRSEADENKIHGDVLRYGLEAIDLYQDELPDAKRLPCLWTTLSAAVRHRRRCPELLRECRRQLRSGSVRDALQRLYPIAVFQDRGPYDIVHAHYGINGTWGLALRRAGAFRAKLVTTFHDGFDLSTHLRRHGEDVYRELFAEGDLCLAISDNVRQRLVALGCPGNKVAVHRVGIDLRRFEVRPRAPGAPRILTIARLVEMKGVEFGIRAVARLASDYPGLEYSIAGDGLLRPALESLAVGLGITRSVHFLGWRDQGGIQALFEETDVLLAPSVTDSSGAQEGLPTVLMEALASRVPVVATGYSGIPELVRDGVEGFLAAERDVVQLSDRLRKLLDDEDLRREMGERGRARVEELHNIDRLNDRLVERYRDLAGASA